tara:strand:- start:305 stop:1306 length:1002 start_codon:yes stop_codon:yes gene_type:complete
MKIFISIASYQDLLLPITINSAYTNAKFKENIRFGIVDQCNVRLDFSKAKIKDQITYLHIEPKNARGPCWARSLAQTLMNDEEYFLQVDSHTTFEKDWDEYLIKYIKTIKKDHKKPVISAYPRGFEIVDFNKKIFRKLQEDDHSTHVMILDKEKSFKDGYFSMQKGLPSTSKSIYKGFLLSAGFLFGESEMVEQVPYDPNLYFEGEETTMALRLFTNGFDIFHIPRIPLFHCYVDYSNEAKRPMHWNEEENKDRTVKWQELQSRSKERISKIITGDMKGSFGLGLERTLDEYKELSGIDIKNRKVIDEDKAYTFKKLFETDWKTVAKKKNFLW